MTWLSTHKAITLFLKSGVSSIGTREFIIIFHFVIKFFLVPFWSWFIFYHVCFGRQSFGLCNNTLLHVCVFNDDVGDQIWKLHLFVFVLQLLFVISPRLRKLFDQQFGHEFIKQGNAFSFDIFKQLVVFVYLDFDLFVFDHLPAVVVSNHEPLSNNVFDNVFKDKGIPNIFCFLVRATDVEQIVW